MLTVIMIRAIRLSHAAQRRAEVAISGASSGEQKFCPTGIASFRFEELERAVHVICMQDLAPDLALAHRLGQWQNISMPQSMATLSCMRAV